jgi:hypothetical protein
LTPNFNARHSKFAIEELFNVRLTEHKEMFMKAPLDFIPPGRLSGKKISVRPDRARTTRLPEGIQVIEEVHDLKKLQRARVQCISSSDFKRAQGLIDDNRAQSAKLPEVRAHETYRSRANNEYVRFYRRHE